MLPVSNSSLDDVEPFDVKHHLDKLTKQTKVEFYFDLIFTTNEGKHLFYTFATWTTLTAVNLLVWMVAMNIDQFTESIFEVMFILGLGVSLYAHVKGKQPQDFEFTYGYTRMEVLAAFTNMILIAILCLFNILNDSHHWIESMELHQDATVEHHTEQHHDTNEEHGDHHGHEHPDIVPPSERFNAKPVQDHANHGHSGHGHGHDESMTLFSFQGIFLFLSHLILFIQIVNTITHLRKYWIIPQAQRSTAQQPVRISEQQHSLIEKMDSKFAGQESLYYDTKVSQMYRSSPNSQDLNLNAVVILLLVHAINLVWELLSALLGFNPKHLAVSIITVFVVYSLSIQVWKTCLNLLLQGLNYLDLSRKDYEKLKSQIQYIDGVMFIQDVKCWSMGLGYLVAYVKVEISDEYDQGSVSAQIQKLLRSDFKDVYVECIKEEEM